MCCPHTQGQYTKSHILKGNRLAVSSRHLSTAPSFGWGLMNPSLIHAVMLTGVDLIQVLCRQPQLHSSQCHNLVMSRIYLNLPPAQEENVQYFVSLTQFLKRNNFLILIFPALGSTSHHILVQGASVSS